jgi:hypothetical protein
MTAFKIPTTNRARNALLAACAAITLGASATAAHADASLGVSTPVPPTQVRIWYRATTAFVTESVLADSGHHQCVLHLTNGRDNFGIATTGTAARIFLSVGNSTGNFRPGYIRIQVDNQTPWRIVGEADTGTFGMFTSEPMRTAAGSQFLPQLATGQTVRIETTDNVYAFPLTDFNVGYQAVLACERSLTAAPPHQVRPTAPATRDLVL